MKTRSLLMMTMMGALALSSACMDRERREDRAVDTDMGELERDIDEEFRDPNEPGDVYGGETDTIEGGERGAGDTIQGESEEMGQEIEGEAREFEKDVQKETEELEQEGEELKQDVDEEFRDPNEPGDAYQGEM